MISQISELPMDERIIEITVKLHGVLRRYRPAAAEGAAHHPFPFSLPAGATVRDLTRQLNIANGPANTAAINGENVPNTAELRDGDDVHLFPPAAGG
jgi:molybdopterin converting factor small subunit